MTHTTLIQTKSNKWEDNKGNSIYKDDFGSYIISVNGTIEIANTLEKALKIMDSNRYWD